MSTIRHLLAATALVFASGSPSLSDTECSAVASDKWQDREAVIKHANREGWTLYSIEKDDGCYEIEGVDDQLQYFEIKLTPDTLEIFSAEFTPPLEE